MLPRRNDGIVDGFVRLEVPDDAGGLRLRLHHGLLPRHVAGQGARQCLHLQSQLTPYLALLWAVFPDHQHAGPEAAAHLACCTVLAVVVQHLRDVGRVRLCAQRKAHRAAHLDGQPHVVPGQPVARLSLLCMRLQTPVVLWTSVAVHCRLGQQGRLLGRRGLRGEAARVSNLLAFLG